MKTITYSNRTTITFNHAEIGGKHILRANEITAICKKHNAQDMLFQNVSPYTYNKKGEITGEQLGNAGGTVTFHSHSCNHVEAAKELILLLESWGHENTFYEEVAKTHRADGTAYKCVQYFIEKVKPQLLMF